MEKTSSLIPEGERVYAGFWIRFLAHLIDFVLLNGVEFLLEYGIAKLTGMSSFSQQILGIILSVILAYGYYCKHQVKRGHTIGKQLFSIYVVDAETGESLTHRQAVKRLLGYMVSYIIIGCGFLMAAFHPEKRALHDLIAGTVSIRVKKNAKN